MEDRPAYDCQTCGACCIDPFGRTRYVALAPAEAGRLSRLGLPVLTRTDFDGEEHPQLGTRPSDGPGGETVCAAFAGTVGEACGCSVYPDRPSACRSFEAGASKCRWARSEAGLPV
jgi:Fe-S-cluster containining protein